MKKDNTNKIKLVKILEILRQETDEENPIYTNDLISKLQENGISCRRETLYEDIKVLNEFGYEILCNRGVANSYYIVDRSFDVPELRILIDAVQASSFVTPKKAEQLIDKIAELGGSHRAELLKNNSVLYNTRKHSNESIYYNINEIELAICDKKQIEFKYFDYDINKEKVYRKNGDKYYISPCSMVINNDNYYLVGYNEKHNKILHFRIDRMNCVKKTELDMVYSIKTEQFYLEKHHKELFGMFGGEEKSVSIEFDKSLIDVVIDKFGEQIEFCRTSADNVRVNTTVQVSPQFFSWVCSFGNKMKVVAPKTIVKKVKEYLMETLENYE